MVRKDLTITSEDVHRYTEVVPDIEGMRRRLAGSEPGREYPVGDARKLIVKVHSTALSADNLSLGGLRWRRYSSEEDARDDVENLARGMTFKHAALNAMMTRMYLHGKASLEEVEATRMGGAKAVLYDARDVPVGDERVAVLERVARVLPQCDGYVTAPDMNTNLDDMAFLAKRIPEQVVCLPRDAGGSGDPSVITACGVYHALRAAVDFKYGQGFDEPLTVGVQGLGKVGSYLVNLIMNRTKGVKVVVADVDESRAKALADQFPERVSVCAPDELLSKRMHAFSPNAAGGVLTPASLEQLCSANPQGVAIAGGANNQVDTRIDGDLAQMFYMTGTAYVPDFVANMGGILNVIYEMPLVKDARGGRYNSLRPIGVVAGVYDLAMELFETAGELGTARKAEGLAVETIARWAAVKAGRE